jgi:hypothetical protein
MSSPGPGGFGPSPPFGRARHGVTLVPAQSHPLPGVYNGAAAHTTQVWLWGLLMIIIVAVVVVSVLYGRRRRSGPEPQ